jgi:hypothetical protein
MRPADGRSAVERALSKRIHVWSGAWLYDRARKMVATRSGTERHLLLAVCDHFEPLHGGVARAVALARVRAWRQRMPEQSSGFRDSTGRAPRHTFFFPGEQYDPALVEPLAELVDLGLAEVEVHLHHDGDTRSTLRAKLEESVAALARHGLVARRANRAAWAFIHGNWSLANARSDGRWCGVDDELRLLHELGCYADFTFPSAPDRTQPRVVNAVYYPRDPSRRRAYDHPEPVRVGSPAREAVLLIQGPLAIARRPGSLSPRIEAAALSAKDPPTRRRLITWLQQRVHVEGRPEWTLVKLHTHGAPEENARMLLGRDMADLHEAVKDLRDGAGWRVHYVTAREMYNVCRAAMDGMEGSPADYFDYEVTPPERACDRAASSFKPGADRRPGARR